MLQRIHVPMSGRPPSVNAWLVRLDAGGWMLVDGGPATDEAWSVLSRAIAAITGGGRPELNVITHMHLDHVGLVDRVRAAYGGVLAMGELDAARRRHAAGNPEEERDYRVEMLRSNGAPAAIVDAASGVAPATSGRFTDADLILGVESRPIEGAPEWISVWTPGHTAGHVALFRPRDRTLIAGDAVIPRVAPAVGVNRQRADPIGDYLDSLARLEALDPRIVLGGHGDTMHGSERIREIRAAVEFESRAVRDLLGNEPVTTWRVARLRYPDRELPPGLWIQVLRSVRAHLDRLARLGVATVVDSGAMTTFARAAAG
jgi:glyoxylase-like metal-dependent hydrolase (beta-lactamase superfamily II)